MNKYDGIKKADAVVSPRANEATRKVRTKSAKRAGVLWRYIFAGLVLTALFTVKAVSPDSAVISGVKEAICYDIEEDLEDALARLLK